MVLFLSDPKGLGALANKSLLFSVFSILVAGAAPNGSFLVAGAAPKGSFLVDGASAKGSLFSNRPVAVVGGAVIEIRKYKYQKGTIFILIAKNISW